MHEIWLLIIAALVATVCALNGSFLVLRKQAMLGDAISHSVLLGIVVVYLVSFDRNVLVMFLGALGAGLLSALLSYLMQQYFHLRQQESIGLVFTSFFALGVILISAYAGNIDLDQACVLFGEIAYTPLDTLDISHVSMGPKAVWMLGGVLCITLVLFGISWNQLKAACFDPLYAKTCGVYVSLWRWMLTALVATVAVAAFDAVGAIMVVAMLSILPNAARKCAKTLSQMLVISCIFGWISAFLGYGMASALDASIAAGMSIGAGLILLVVLLCRNTRAVSQSA